MILLLAPLILICPLIGLPVSFFLSGRTNKFRYSSILALSLFFAIMGFYFVPRSLNSDLVRYFTNYVDVFRLQSFSQIFQGQVTLNKFFIVQNLLFFVSSRFNNDQMLPFLTMFFVYFNGFNIITDFSKRNKLAPRQIWQMLFIFIVAITFTTVVNNIRNILGVSFFCLALYRDLYKKDKSILTLFLYFLGMSTHIAVVGLVLIRILLSFLGSVRSLNIFRVVFVVVFFGATIIVLIKTGVYSAFFEKGLSYLQGGDEGSALQSWFQAADNSGFLTLNKVISDLSSGAFAIIGISEINRRKQQNYQFLLYSVIMNVTVILLSFLSGTIWLRFYFVTYFFIPILFYYSLKEKNKNFKAFLALFWLLFILWNLVLQFDTLASQTYIFDFIKNIFIYPIGGLLKQ